MKRRFIILAMLITIILFVFVACGLAKTSHSKEKIDKGKPLNSTEFCIAMDGFCLIPLEGFI